MSLELHLSVDRRKFNTLRFFYHSSQSKSRALYSTATKQAIGYDEYPPAVAEEMTTKPAGKENTLEVDPPSADLTTPPAGPEDSRSQSAIDNGESLKLDEGTDDQRTTSGHKALVSDHLIDRNVIDLPGISKTLASRLEDQGYGKVSKHTNYGAQKPC